MPDTPSIIINKTFPYRDTTEEVSNVYHFTPDAVPASDAEWMTLYNAIVAAEKPLHQPEVRFVGFYGYQAGNEHAVSIYDPREVGAAQPQGTGAAPGGATVAGDQACWVRWTSTKRTSKGKRVYARKYFHAMQANRDAPIPEWRAAALVYAGKMIDGTLPKGAKYCLPQGEALSTPLVSAWMTTRTLKRRGKRPSS